MISQMPCYELYINYIEGNIAQKILVEWYVFDSMYNRYILN